MEEIFTNIYETNAWGPSDGSSEYKGTSGTGSTHDYNSYYINFMREFIVANKIQSCR